MAKIVLQVLLVLLTVWAMLFSAVEARKLHNFKAAVPKREAAGSGFVVPTLQLSKMFDPKDRCYINQNACFLDGTCRDPEKCMCAIEVNEHFPAVCIERDCVGRPCEDDEGCWNPTCTCRADGKCEIAAPVDDVAVDQASDIQDNESDTAGHESNAETLYDIDGELSDR